PVASPSGKPPDDVRHDAGNPAARSTRAARVTPYSSTLRMATPMAGTPAAANASTSRSKGQPRVVIWLIEKRGTGARYPGRRGRSTVSVARPPGRRAQAELRQSVKAAARASGAIGFVIT